jgi:hypothetical protein
MIYYGRTVKSILLFMMMILLLKIIPIYTLYNTSIKTSDITATFILLLIYIVWMILNGKDLEYLFLSTKKIVNGNFIIPGMKFLQFFKNLHLL